MVAGDFCCDADWNRFHEWVLFTVWEESALAGHGRKPTVPFGVVAECVRDGARSRDGRCIGNSLPSSTPSAGVSPVDSRGKSRRVLTVRGIV